MAAASVFTNRRASVPNLSGHQMVRGSAIEMQEQDRRRISQELHDDLGQRLALLEIQLTQLQENCGCPETAKGLQMARARIEEMDDDVHRICCQLYPVVLEKLGLVVALRSLCREFCQLGLYTKFAQENCRGTVGKSVSLCLYRVVQEALHNVSKHSKSEGATVSLKESSGRLEVVVEDFGVGFHPASVRPAGLGLMSMEERVKRAGGHLSILSSPGMGTRVRVIFHTFVVVE